MARRRHLAQDLFWSLWNPEDIRPIENGTLTDRIRVQRLRREHAISQANKRRPSSRRSLA